jgi:hypothetical protein
MNKLEARYAAYLELRRRNNLIAGFWYETIKFRLADRTWYTPDFLVQRHDGSLEIHETKGFLRDDANVKLKVTADLYWLFPVFLVRETRGAFTLTPINP